MYDLACVCREEQQKFLESFDDVLCDVDGVIWFLMQKIPGSLEAISALSQNGKRIIFVSNNSTSGSKKYQQQLKEIGLSLNPINLIIPSLAIIDYLKSINFNKEAFVIGTKNFKQDLEEAGIKIYDYKPHEIEETITALAEHIKDDEKIGAVIADMSINVNYVMLQKAVTCLKRDDCLFITGSSDAEAPIKPNYNIIGPKYFHDALEDLSKRKKFSLAKPNVKLNDFIVKTYNIRDPSRVLFIGDTVPEDMGFATNCGYQKLLVLSGLTKLDDLKNWKWCPEYKPKYYVDSLKVIADILCNKCP